jgi:hypothetical protein
MDLGLHIAVHARKKSFLRHTAGLSLREKFTTLSKVPVPSDTNLREQYDPGSWAVPLRERLFAKELVWAEEQKKWVLSICSSLRARRMKLPITRAVSMGGCNTGLKFTSGSLKA